MQLLHPKDNARLREHFHVGCLVKGRTEIVGARIRKVTDGNPGKWIHPTETVYHPRRKPKVAALIFKSVEPTDKTSRYELQVCAVNLKDFSLTIETRTGLRVSVAKVMRMASQTTIYNPTGGDNVCRSITVDGIISPATASIGYMKAGGVNGTLISGPDPDGYWVVYFSNVPTGHQTIEVGESSSNCASVNVTVHDC